ncbi:Gfo/Idh/MocA family protein [Kordiimonas sp. SCSIO 12610]|uniref:Gfo/Idh/MocA family protein n=1 Tax=Kordiimonas sp. SCSIO 12610 TaxID=2829597 RepID=UPI00210C97BD|nr:Gfo/Idh/MocA family oxidoreductase [Kordiimonas sp. SCSIO 12610]UTW54758.1 Gfo/Idh/MocA family oxidoreductase [Kordiimonas sp. SCSIO 12610]
MTNKNYGIIGCGMMGVEHIKNIKLLDGADVTAVYDPVFELAENAAKLAGNASVSTSLDQIINNTSLDAIVIVSPNFLHVNQLEKALRQSDANILCEKPLFTDISDHSRIKQLNKRYKDRVWVAMEYRYMPPIEALINQSLDVTGHIELLSIREHRFPFLEKVGDWNRFNKNTGGTFVEKCCHFFDLMRLILRAEPIRVAASGGQAANHLDENYNGETPDIWDSGYVLVDFDNGSRAMLELCMFADGSLWNEEISAVGAKGKIECRLPGPHRFWPSDLGEPPHSQLTISPRTPKKPVTTEITVDSDLLLAGDHHGSTYYQHQQFLKLINNGGVPDVSIEDGRMAVLMGMAAQIAASEKRVVELSEFD